MGETRIGRREGSGRRRDELRRPDISIKVYLYSGFVKENWRGRRKGGRMGEAGGKKEWGKQDREVKVGLDLLEAKDGRSAYTNR